MKKVICLAMVILALGCGGGGGGGGGGNGGGGGGGTSPLGVPADFKATGQECLHQYPTLCQVDWLFTWTDKASAETEYQFYWRQEKLNPDPAEEIISLPANSTEYQMWASADADSTFTVKVRVTDGANYSAWSTTIALDISDFCGYCQANPP